MVEKNRPVSENADLERSPLRDVLEHADKTFSSSSQEQIDAKDAKVNETPGLNSGNENDKFNTLCDDVLTAHSLFDLYLTEMLTIKDELLKHSLPSNLLLNFTLTCSKLYRSASDLNTPTSELVRLVRLYSPQWEAKSNILKKIHDDYESKQRRLDIALKKLELVGVASERMEKEKRIMNWEKLYSKIMSAKSHGHRWKFLIGSLKEKVKTGDILSIPYPSNSKDDVPDSTSEPFVPRHHRRNVHSLRHQALMRREGGNNQIGVSNNRLQEDSEMSSEEDPQTLSQMRKRTTNQEMRPNFTASRFKSRYPFEKEAGPAEFSRRLRSERVESPTGIRNSSGARTQNRRFLKKNVSFVDESPENNKPTLCAKEDKSVWTGETEYDRFLHVRLYKPECRLVPEPKCTICIGEQVFSSKVYSNELENSAPSSEVNKSSHNAKENLKYQEFTFTLPADNVYQQGGGITSINSLQMRIAIQGERGGPIVAMSTVGYDELEISQNVVDSDEESLSPKKYPLLSLVSNKETMFNSGVGHVPLICYETKKERLRFVDQSTQTLSFQELVDEIIAAKKKEEDENRIEEDIEEKKIYTETEFEEIRQKHIEELEYIRSEYELQLQEIARISMRASPDGFSNASAEPKFISACTSPIPQNALSPTVASSLKTSPRPRTADARLSPKRTKKVRTGHTLPEWGKNLPENFFDRLELFSRASAKYHQDLNEKTKKAVQENYELQMATQNRLSPGDDELDLNDVCLPALFMPSRMGTVYSPKASLYFHPSGVSRDRFTQAPSVFKLPSSVERNSSSVMNLFNLSQNFVTSGPTWLSQDTRPASARTTRTKKHNFFNSPSLIGQDTAVKMKSE